MIDFNIRIKEKIMKIKMEKNYIQIGTIAFIVIAMSIAVYFIFDRIDEVKTAISSAFSILGPFIYGLVMAYLLCPIYNLTYRNVVKSKLLSRLKTGKRVVASKIISSTVSIITMIAIISGLLWMVLPGLIESLVGIVKMLPSKISEFSIWASDLSKKLPEGTGIFSGWSDIIVKGAQDFSQNTLLPKSQILIEGITGSVFGLVSGLKNFSVGIIICVFFLNSKEIFAAQIRKITFVIMEEENAFKFLYGARFVNKTFGKFINGKLIDSLIIGIICFIGMSIFNWPYKLLISVIVGVTNIIPFFGPFIGAIPSALLIFIVDPMTSLYFMIFILALQQLDGNVIGPKILGESTGLPSFWVMFAILVGGGVFGFVGMVMGIPMFACVYAYTAYTVNRRLSEKGLSTDLNVYKELGIKLDEKVGKTSCVESLEK